MDLRLEGICINFPGFAMKDFSLHAKEGSFTSIVGPSGCGKTTILRAIAGLEKPSSGKIFFGGVDCTFSGPEERNVGLVFQNDSLFSHMSVLENVAFGPKMRKLSVPQKIAKDALSTVHFSGFEGRSIETLSGGERKRVAIARAIASKPSVLLLDEPMNGLDARLRENMKAFLRELRGRTGLTIILVTHDIDEAFSLSDKIVVMNNGSVEQIGSAIEIFTKPATEFVREFVSDYIIATAKGKKVGGKGFIEGKFRLPAAKTSGMAYVSIKKWNYRFEK